MSRFDHLKNRVRETPKSLEEFIEGAPNDTTAIVAKKRKSKEQVLLSINGKIKRDECAKPPILLYLKKDLKEELETYCAGHNQAIVNYLIKRGLEALKEKGEFILEIT